MSQYLQLRCGPYGLLLDLRHVVEVGDVAAGTGAGWRAWRERNLRVIDLCAHLGVGMSGRRQQVVVADEDGFSILEVDQVEGLRDFEATRFAALDELSTALARFADAVVADPLSTACLLRLRHPVDSQPAGP